MQIADDTIVAISTPPGRGGIGVVRLSGGAAKEIAATLVSLKRPLEAGRASFALVIDVDATAVLDQAVVTFFEGPRSYTGEDVVEIAAHGAPVLLDALLRRCVAAGARLAAPGEFTARAFLAGRMDLTQAEAVDELIQATTLQQARTAARQMGGAVSRQVRPVKERLIDLIAAMEAGIDFAEDDLDVLPGAEILLRLEQIEAPLAKMEASFAYGRVLRDGFRLAIVGRPNAGKSSLFNRLVRSDRAIVTAQPGTTRDLVAERLEFGGVPVEIVDTAGLRATGSRGEMLDEAEAIGVTKSREAMADADVVLLVVAAEAQPHGRALLHEEDRAVMRGPVGASAVGRTAGLVVAVNKIDLVRARESFGGPTHRLRQGRDEWGKELISELGLEIAVVETSALEDTGIEELRSAVLRELKAIAPGADSATVTNLRQQQAIAAAAAAVRAAIEGVDRDVPHEMMLIDLHEALEQLDALTGATHTEEILGVIFSRFCVGK